MSLSGLHTLANYQDELHKLLKQMEGFNNGLPYFDAAGSGALVTIGIGANIDTESKYLGYVLAELGIDGKVSEIDSTKTANQLIKEAIDAVPNGNANNPALQSALNDVLQKNFPSLYGKDGTIKPYGTFILSETQAYNVLDKIVADKKTALDAKLTANGIDVNAMQGTKEYLVLTSLNYNTKQGATNLIGPKLLDALKYDNRAEAWYEIRYGSNKNGIHASRRYSEANLFSLYDYGSYAGSLTPDEAKEVMRMYTLHRTKIDDYETTYSPPLNQGILSIGNEILLAKDYLITNFAPGKTINEVIVGAGLSTYEYKDKGNYKDNLLGTANNDLIFGEKGDDSIVADSGDDVVYGGESNDFIAGETGDDTLYGETGNDQIIGGVGNDILEGGAGNDDYIFQSGDGSDKINDNEGTNQIIWEDSNGDLHVEKTFYKTAEAEWKSADGTTEVNQNSPYKMVFPDGTTVELGESISSFDINLKDVPANPILNHEIVEDNWYDEAFLGGIIDTGNNDHLLVV